MVKQSIESKLANDLIGQDELTVHLPQALIGWGARVGARDHSQIPIALDFLYHQFIHRHFETEMLPLMENYPFCFMSFKRAFRARVRPIVLRYFDEMAPPALKLDLNL